MSSFPRNLHTNVTHPLKLKGGRQTYRLLRSFPYKSDLFGLITAPRGLVTDFASIPRLVWVYIDPEDPVILYASVIHDAIYQDTESKLTRKQADKVLIEAMKVCGARWDQRKLVYGTVRMFGGKHWK